MGLLEEGDIIEVDIPNRSLHWKLDEEAITRRRAEWPGPPAAKVTRGYLARYVRQVTSAYTGAVLKPE